MGPMIGYDYHVAAECRKAGPCFLPLYMVIGREKTTTPFAHRIAAIFRFMRAGTEKDTGRPVMQPTKFFKSLALGGAAALISGAAWAQNTLPSIGKPSQDGMGFQPAVTELAEDLQWFDGMLLIYITIICVLVTAAMLYVFVRFNRRANPTPATFTHNTPLEIVWTVVPALSLVIIALFFSLPVLFKQLRIPEADVTIKAIGNQWYWTYEYVDHEFGFDSLMIGGDSRRLTDEVRSELIEAGYQEDEWLLATDTAVVIPVGKTIVLQVTGADVIHAWTIPSFGVKQDAVPGRLAELWFKAEREGVYFGQCSELCGKDHTYMPITVKVVSEEEYARWLEGAVEEYAGDPTTLPGISVASAD